MSEVSRSLIVFLPVLGVLVFVHELGHYLAARVCGVHVDTFSIGFGRAVLRWTDRVGTSWKIGWLPLGGYVHLHGSGEPGGDEADPARADKVFRDKPLAARSLVVAAGPIANFLLAMVLFAGLYATVGRETMAPRLGEVVSGGAASRAGLRAEDLIRRIGDVAIEDFEQVQRLVVASPDRTLPFAVVRDGAEIVVPVTVGRRPGGGPATGQLGVRAKGDVDHHRLNPFHAFVEAVTRTGEGIAQVGYGLWQIVTGRHGMEDLGGPVRIAQISGQVATLGLGSVIAFVALLSINLGVVNLLPVPMLDGGHLVFDAIEALRGRPVPLRTRERSFQIGGALLAALFLFSTWNDLSRLGVMRWAVGLVHRS